MLRFGFFMLLVLLIAGAGAAQEACPEVIQTALSSLDRLCASTERNQLCYGNHQIAVTTVGSVDLDFEAPGDLAPLAVIETISLSPLQEPDSWGAGLMKVQANLPDTLPGQNVTFVLFGSVQIENAAAQDTIISAVAVRSMNVRSGPSADFPASGRLAAERSVDLSGRNAAGDWVYFNAPDLEGWVYVPLLTMRGDEQTLPFVPDDYSAVSYRPMQAFYFASGINDSPCLGAPDSGVLIQTSELQEPVELVINDTHIELGSTAFLKANPGEAIWVYVVEGQAVITAADTIRVVPAGAFSIVPLDEEGSASGPPSSPESYNMEELTALPVAVLAQPVRLAPPASPELLLQAEEIAAARAQGIMASGSALYAGGSGWVDTGVWVAAGQTVVITASGGLNLWPNCEADIHQVETTVTDCATMNIGPDGQVIDVAPDDFPIPGEPIGRLIARIGSGAPSSIGSSGSFVASEGGTLQFMINDSDGLTGDDEGEFSIQFSVNQP